jgi:hypothetical protein
MDANNKPLLTIERYWNGATTMSTTLNEGFMNEFAAASVIAVVKRAKQTLHS